MDDYEEEGTEEANYCHKDIWIKIKHEKLDENKQIYCIRSVCHVDKCFNNNTLYCYVTFKVDKTISILGIQVPSQLKKDVSKILYIDTIFTYYINYWILFLL